VNSQLTTLLHNIGSSRVYDVARETPLEAAAGLSSRVGNEVLLKREDMQPIFSFKLRGAYNKIVSLDAAGRSRGIISASAGNHAQGVAYSARKLGLRAIIVMPQTTPRIKVEAVRALGAEVVLAGDNYPEAQEHCDQMVTETGMSFIHPFDDPLVIAGQGTIGAEILEQNRKPSAVFVPVGGGGLIAGIAGYVKSLQPDVKVIGVEPLEADAMYRSLAEGRRVELDHVGIFAEGVAARQVGELTFDIVRETVDEIVLVSNDETCAAIKDIFDETRTVMEPAGALAVAGLKAWVAREGTRNQSLVAIASGANINFDRLRFVAERAEVGEAREALLAVTIPEQRGAFREFCATIGRRVVTEFNYRLSDRQVAHLFVGLAVQSRQDATDVAELLASKGYEVVNLTDNEMAKLHVRHMVGGRASAVQDERLCRFEFPERPGALVDFLDKLANRWNISLFHYRNHGADFGRVLAGFEVPDAELSDFREFLGALDYSYTIETDNPAYKFFLQH
jgi:threonine dehydratase